MPVLRLSACRNGALGDQSAPWHLFGSADPERLEGDARAAEALDPIRAQGGPNPFSTQVAFKDDALLAGHLAGLPDTAFGAPGEPVVVFVHGFQFETRRAAVPRIDSDNPHRRLFHFEEAAGDVEREHALHLTPWLARTFGADGHCDAGACRGLAVCFGYSSYGDTNDDETPGLLDFLDSIIDFTSPTGRPQNFYALAYRDAMIAGHGLAAVLVHLRRRLDAMGRSGQRIDIISHSLGTRTVMKAIETLAARHGEGDRTLEQVGKVILLAGACLWEQAGAALRRIEDLNPNRRPEFFNILSDADGVVRVLGARASLGVARREAGLVVDDTDRIAAFIKGAGLIGREGKPPLKFYPGTAAPYRHWVDINLNDARVQDWARALGFDLSGERGLFAGDHWVHFTHRPNWALYRRILEGAPGWGAAALADAVPA